jgi:hypothetical protein
VSLPLPPLRGSAADILRPTTSGKAIAGLVLGLLSFLFGVLASIPAFVYAARGINEINRDPAHVKGRALALVGIFAAGLGLFLQPMLLIYGVERARDWVHRRTDAANLQRIGEAMYACNDDRGHLPPAAIESPDGQPLLSWRVALLPYLGEKGLYEQFHLDEPWDSPHNFDLIARMPKVYAHPADPDAAAQGSTYYCVFVGKDTPFGKHTGPNLSRLPGGTLNTLLVVAAAEPAPWTKPQDIPYDSLEPVPRLCGLLRGGSNVLRADNTVHFVRDGAVQEETLRRLIISDNGFGGK